MTPVSAGVLDGGSIHDDAAVGRREVLAHASPGPAPPSSQCPDQDDSAGDGDRPWARPSGVGQQAEFVIRGVVAGSVLHILESSRTCKAKVQQDRAPGSG